MTRAAGDKKVVASIGWVIYVAILSGPQKPVRHLPPPLALGQRPWRARRNPCRLQLRPDRSCRGRMATAEAKHAPHDWPDLLGVAPRPAKEAMRRHPLPSLQALVVEDQGITMRLGAFGVGPHHGEGEGPHPSLV